VYWKDFHLKVKIKEKSMLKEANPYLSRTPIYLKTHFPLNFLDKQGLSKEQRLGERRRRRWDSCSELRSVLMTAQESEDVPGEPAGQSSNASHC
jgi:hypothetical protein